jgi:hypothetical protein
MKRDYLSLMSGHRRGRCRFSERIGPRWQRKGFRVLSRNQNELSGERLLDAGDLSIAIDERLEKSEDMAPVFDHTFQMTAQAGLTFGVTVPAFQNAGRHINIPAEFFGGMPAQEKAVKEGRLMLRGLELPFGIFGEDGCVPHMRKWQFTETRGGVKRKTRFS